MGPGSLGLAEFLEDALVRLLLSEVRVLINFLSLVNKNSVDVLELLRVAESRVQHLLIVSHEGHFACKALVPMVLRPRVNVVLLLERGRVRLVSSSIVVDLRILPKVIVERTLLIRWLVNLLEATGTVRDVRVATSAIIRVVNRF